MGERAATTTTTPTTITTSIHRALAKKVNQHG